MANAKQVDFLLAGLLDSTGNPLSSGLVYTYESGTTTNKTCWTAADKSASATNPVVLDAYGKATLYADGTYTFLVKTSAGATVTTINGLEYSIPTTSNKTVTLVSADYTALSTDDIIGVSTASGNVTISFPTAIGISGKEYLVFKTTSDSNTVIIDPYSTQTIGGDSTKTLTKQYQYIEAVSDNSNWQGSIGATLTGTEILTNKVFTLPQINDTTGDHQYVFAVNELAADRTVTLPLLTGDDEFVFKDHTATLTNKTLTSPAINTPTMIGGTARTNIYAPQGVLVNGKISATVASNNLTLAIKTLAGTDPSATDPVYIRIGNTVRTISAALSVTKNAGTNWCNLGSTELAAQDVDVFAYLGYNATDGVVVGFSRISDARVYSDFSATTTDQKYAAISTITTAAATDEYENIGRFNVTLSAGAGYTWSIPATAIVVNRPIFETRRLLWVPTVAGFTGSPTATVRYQLFNSIMHVEADISGTSNATNFEWSIPFKCNNSFSLAGQAEDNGSILTAPAMATFANGSQTVTMYSTWANGVWTNANGKKLYLGRFIINI